MEAVILGVELVGPTIGVRARDAAGRQAFVQVFDLPFDRDGVLSCLERAFLEAENPVRESRPEPNDKTPVVALVTEPDAVLVARVKEQYDDFRTKVGKTCEVAPVAEVREEAIYMGEIL